MCRGPRSRCLYLYRHDSPVCVHTCRVLYIWGAPAAAGAHPLTTRQPAGVRPLAGLCSRACTRCASALTPQNPAALAPQHPSTPPPRSFPCPQNVCGSSRGLGGRESIFKNHHTNYFFGNSKCAHEAAKPGFRPRWGRRVHERGVVASLAGPVLEASSQLLLGPSLGLRGALPRTVSDLLLLVSP